MAKERPLSLPFPVSRLVSCELVRFGLRHQRSLFPSQPSVLLILSEQARIQTPSCYFFPKQPILGFSLPFFSSFRISPEELVTGIYIHQTQTSSKNYREKIEKIQNLMAISKNVVWKLGKCSQNTYLTKDLSRIYRELRRCNSDKKKLNFLSGQNE